MRRLAINYIDLREVQLSAEPSSDDLFAIEVDDLATVYTTPGKYKRVGAMMSAKHSEGLVAHLLQKQGIEAHTTPFIWKRDMMSTTFSGDELPDIILPGRGTVEVKCIGWNPTAYQGAQILDECRVFDAKPSHLLAYVFVLKRTLGTGAPVLKVLARGCGAELDTVTRKYGSGSKEKDFYSFETSYLMDFDTWARSLRSNTPN